MYTFSVFERIPRVPRQSGGTYSGNVARMKTGNLHRDAVIRRHINWDLKNNQAFKSKEMMNSSNYILVTYLSDIESKLIPCHCFRVLANLSFQQYRFIFACRNVSVVCTYATRLAIHALYFKLQLIFEVSSSCFVEIQPILARHHS